jgi:hypothetical protein
VHTNEQLFPDPKLVYIVFANPLVHGEQVVRVEGYVPTVQFTQPLPIRIAPGGHGIAHWSRIRACQP